MNAVFLKLTSLQLSIPIISSWSAACTKSTDTAHCGMMEHGSSGVLASVGFFCLVMVLQSHFVGSNADLWLRFLQEHLEVWTLLLWPKLRPLWWGFDLPDNGGITEMWQRDCWALAEPRGMAGVVHPSHQQRNRDAWLGWGWLCLCCLQHGNVELHGRVRTRTHEIPLYSSFLFQDYFDKGIPFFSSRLLLRLGRYPLSGRLSGTQSITLLHCLQEHDETFVPLVELMPCGPAQIILPAISIHG